MIIVLIYILSLITGIIFITLKPRTFLPIIIAFCSLNPIIEKLTDPSLYGATWKVLSFERVWPEYALLILLIIINLSSIKKGQIQPINSNLTLGKFLIAWALGTLVVSFFGMRIDRTLILLPFVFGNPILIFIYLKRQIDQNIYDIKALKNSILNSVLIFLVIGFIFFLGSNGFIDLINGNFETIRIKTGIWLGNHGIQILSLFIPFILFLPNNKTKKMVISLIVLSLIIGASRTNYLIMVLAILFILYQGMVNKTINKKKVFGLFLVLFLGVLLVNQYLSGYSDFLFDRFGVIENTNGLALETKEDGRYIIWNEAKEIISNSPFTGVGLGNFGEIEIRGFTDAHNIFLSIWAETGTINLMFFILILTFVFLKRYESFELKLLKFGLFLFLINGLTGSQLFIVSGFVSSAMFIFFAVFLCLASSDQFFSQDLK